MNGSIPVKAVRHNPLTMLYRLALVLLLGGLPLVLYALDPPTPRQTAKGKIPAKLEDGSYLLPNGWSISPAGTQIALGGMPLKAVPFPDNRHLLVMSNGYTEHFVAILDLESEKVVQRVPIKQGWLGLAIRADGQRVYASAGGEDRILVFQFVDGKLTPAHDIKLAEGSFPAGLLIGKGGRNLYVTANLGNALQVVDLATEKVRMNIAVGVKPYSCVVTGDEKTAYVSNWGEDSVAVIDLDMAKTVKTIRVQEHPNDLILDPRQARLFVANGNRNTVSIIDTAKGELIEQIDVAIVPKSPPGTTPNALELDAESKTLYVANADNNAVAVVDVSKKGQSIAKGFIPAGWYPTGVCLAANGKKLVIANGKGSVSRENASIWKRPVDGSGKTNPGYIGNLMQGTLSIVPIPDAPTLEIYSAKVHRNSPYSKQRATDWTAPFPLGARSPIQHVVYIIKENRTYDQVFGDMKEGNGEPRYCLFPEQVTPNLHALARQFVLLDNFYHDAEVSADGHHWVTSAYATDYVQKFWPSMYAGRGRQRKDLHDDPVANSSGGFIWDLCKKAGLSYRSYGEFARRAGAEPGMVKAGTPSLEGHIHPTYYGADGIAHMSDSKRLELWLAEFREFEKKGNMPRFQVLSLPGDHTLGTRPKVQTPIAMVAENDLAVGKIVEALAGSKFWKSTAIFIVEDDAQDGPDHVDCHRTVAMVISPYNRHGFVDSTMYSTSSMLRTMELILGLPPLTQYDASATPMWASFQASPDLRPFKALPAQVAIDEKNTASAYGAERSLALSLDEADRTPAGEMNDILWKSIQGPDSPVPPRRIAAFVRERKDD